MRLGRTAKTLVLALTALAVAAAIGGAWRFKRYVDEDPRLLARGSSST